MSQTPFPNYPKSPLSDRSKLDLLINAVQNLVDADTRNATSVEYNRLKLIHLIIKRSLETTFLHVEPEGAVGPPQSE